MIVRSVRDIADVVDDGYANRLAQHVGGRLVGRQERLEVQLRPGAGRQRSAQDSPRYQSAIPAVTGKNPSNTIVAPLRASVPAMVTTMPTPTSTIANRLQSWGIDHVSKRRAR